MKTIKGKCIDYSSDGRGVVKINNKTIFVDSLLIGEEADILITFDHKDYAFGKIKKIYNLSENRIKPLCPVSSACGGCSFQNLSYEKELEYKSNKVRQALVRIGDFKDINVNNTIGMANPYHYRNKIQMPFQKDKKGKIIYGFYRSNTHEIIPIDSCSIEDERAAKILQDIKKLFEDMKISIYDEDKRIGLIRHVLIRTSFHKKEVMVVLVTTGNNFPSRNNFAKKLHALHPEIITIIENVNKRKTNVILGEEEHILLGRGFIEDSLLGVNFRISSKSFFQVNPVQTEILYQIAMNYASLNNDDVVLDAYSGIGTIGLSLASKVKEVIGVEIIKEAVQDAISNAKRNKIENAKYYVGDAGDFLKTANENKISVSVVVLDPPRKGASEEFLKALLFAKPKKIVYVSCDPATLARDLKMLSLYYDIIKVQPVDMFPRTCHVETIVGLILKK